MEANQLPDIIVGGAPKCGTSSVYFWLAAHPQVCASPVKETFFFADEVSRFNSQCNVMEHGLEDYAKYFQACSSDQLKMEATAPYIYYRNALEQIPNLASQPKVMMWLREPAARLYSQYRFERYRTQRINMSWDEYRAQPELIAHGRYSDYLAKWKDALGDSRLYVDSFENLVSDPVQAMQRAAKFLNIDASFYDRYDFVQHNETVAIRAKFLHRLGLRAQRFIPHSLQEKLLPIYLKINAGKMPPKESNDKEGVESLRRNEFASEQQQLEALFPDLDLSSWGS